MNRTARLAVAALFCACALAPAPALALLARVTVSAARGNDADPNCGSAASPCRSLQVAHDRVAPGGEIDILDPGGYGALTITKSVSIVNDGVGVSGSLNTSGDAIVVDAGASGVVTIKGLTLNGLGTAVNGVRIVSAKKVVFSRLFIQNFTVGIEIESGTDLDFTIADTTTTSNLVGIDIRNTGGVLVQGAVLRAVANHNNQRGLIADNVAAGVGATKVSVDESVFDDNFGIGVLATRGASIAARRVASSHNGVGFFGSDGGAVSIDDCVAFDNAFDVARSPSGGAVTTFQNNQFKKSDGTLTNATLH